MNVKIYSYKTLVALFAISIIACEKPIGPKEEEEMTNEALKTTTTGNY